MVIGKEISWAEANGLRIADRCLCTNISWDQLNELGLVHSTLVSIDGQQYICRLLRVGEDKNGPNEWENALDATSEEDELWHWRDLYFWRQDTLKHNLSRRVVRGNFWACYRYHFSGSLQSVDLGFRSVLETLTAESLVSDRLLNTKLAVYLQQDCVELLRAKLLLNE